MVVRVRFVTEEDAHEFTEAQRAVATAGAEVVEDGAVTLATQGNGNVTAMLEPVGRDVTFAIGTNAEVARAAVEPLVGASVGEHAMARDGLVKMRRTRASSPAPPVDPPCR